MAIYNANMHFTFLSGVTGALPEDMLAVVFQLNDDLEQLLARYSKSTATSSLLDLSPPVEDDFSQLARRNSGSIPMAAVDVFSSQSAAQPLKVKYPLLLL